jgi:hypothetical protein
MPEFLRLKQICLLASDLKPAAIDIGEVMGLDICYRDPHVGAYGLENVLYPVDSILLEVVAPTKDNTAVGRYLERLKRPDVKEGWHGGYMVIFTASDTERRRDHAKSIGIRVAHEITRPEVHIVQLHPADCRGAFVDFNRTKDSDGVYGPYAVAGPDWPKFIRNDITLEMAGIEVESPDPAGLAAHWAKLIEVPVGKNAAGEPELSFVNSTFRFIKGPKEVLSGLVFKVKDVAKIKAAAAAKGYVVEGDSFHMCGVNFRLVA